MSEKVVEEASTPPEASKYDPIHDDYIGNRRRSMDDVIDRARTATEKEHRMSLWQGIKLYPKAVGWSILISTCICMEGYDVCLLSNFCG
jgi:MFS transporter, SP family, general alpha glucoside:H+ symporter